MYALLTHKPRFFFATLLFLIGTQPAQSDYSFNYPTEERILLYTTIIASLSSLGYACYQDKLPCPTQDDYNFDRKTVNIMLGNDGTIRHMRFAIGADWQRPLYQSAKWLFTGRTELNLTHWYTTQKNPQVANGQIFGLMPIHQLIYLGWQNYRPMLEFGVGPQYMTSHIVENKEKSTQFQFSDTIGIGLQYKDIEIGYRFTHYSNANIKTPNAGFDTQNLNFSIKF